MFSLEVQITCQSVRGKKQKHTIIKSTSSFNDIMIFKVRIALLVLAYYCPVTV